MSKYSEVNMIISYENNVDYWGDEESAIVENLITEFNDDDWENLRREWNRKSMIWQERCAQVLDAKPCQQSFEILNELLASKSYDVIANAIEGLKSFDNSFTTKEFDKIAVKNAVDILNSSNLLKSYKNELIQFLLKNKKA